MKLSLGSVLVVCLVGLQFIAIATILTTSYVTSERALLHHARTLISDVAQNTVEHSRGFLKPAASAAEFAKRLAENDIVASNDNTRLEKLLFQQLATQPEFAGVFYGDEDGNFVFVKNAEEEGQFQTKIISNSETSRTTDLIWRNANFEIIRTTQDPLDDFDPRERPWYQDVEKQGSISWTDPYIFFTSKLPGITVAAPVADGKGGLQGVVGVDIEIAAISDFLAAQSIGEQGKAIILNKNGDVIAHPNSELIKMVAPDGTLRFAAISEIDDPVARAAFAYLDLADPALLEKESDGNFMLDGRAYVSTITPAMSDELPWSIGVFAPQDDFIGTIKTNRTQNTLVAALIAVLTGGLGILLARFINRPVKALAERATLISQGNLDEAQRPYPIAFSELEQANATISQEVARRKKLESERSMMFSLGSRGMAEIAVKTGHVLRTNSVFDEIFGFEPGNLSAAEGREIARLIDVTSGLPQELDYARKDGKTVSLLVNAFSFDDMDTGAMRAFVAVDDVTDAKIAERKVRELSREISHGDRLTTMGQMAAGLAHELNQPLTAITQNVDAALTRAQELADQDREQIEILTEIDRQAHRSADIIRALRAFIRKDEGHNKLFDLRELIDQTIVLVEAEAKENGVKIETDIGPLPLVRGMRVQIAQVLVNLLRNGIEAFASADTKPRRISIAAEQISQRVDIMVTDTGPGAASDLEIFGEFQTTKKNGMGLGLSICRNIVEAHGGELRYDRIDGAGSRFSFSLPTGDAV